MSPSRVLVLEYWTPSADHHPGPRLSAMVANRRPHRRPHSITCSPVQNLLAPRAATTEEDIMRSGEHRTGTSRETSVRFCARPVIDRKVGRSRESGFEAAFPLAQVLIRHGDLHEQEVPTVQLRKPNWLGLVPTHEQLGRVLVRKIGQAWLGLG